MSIYGPCEETKKENSGEGDLSEYAKKTYVSSQMNQKVNKSGDSMSGNLNMVGNSITNLDSPTRTNDAANKQYVDDMHQDQINKRGDRMEGDLDMRSNVIRGLQTTYPPIYNGDEAVSWRQVVDLVADSKSNIDRPTESRHAVNKEYVDSRKPIITIWAEESGPINSNEYEWAFGNGASGTSNRKSGYTMMRVGRIIDMGLACSVRGAAFGVNIVVNGVENTSYRVTKNNGELSNTTRFETPLELGAGTVINFKTDGSVTSPTCSVVTLLIELDM